MASLNRCLLIGNCGRDPEIRSLQSGSRIATFSLATSESWNDKGSGERKEQTTWHNISIFNENLVGIVEKYVKKGSKLYVEGSLRTRKYTDKSLVERTVTEVVLSGFTGTIVLLDRVADVDRSEQPVARKRSADLLDDDIPF